MTRIPALLEAGIRTVGGVLIDAVRDRATETAKGMPGQEEAARLAHFRNRWRL